MHHFYFPPTASQAEAAAIAAPPHPAIHCKQAPRIIQSGAGCAIKALTPQSGDINKVRKYPMNCVGGGLFTLRRPPRCGKTSFKPVKPVAHARSQRLHCSGYRQFTAPAPLQPRLPISVPSTAQRRAAAAVVLCITAVRRRRRPADAFAHCSDGVVGVVRSPRPGGQGFGSNISSRRQLRTVPTSGQNCHPVADPLGAEPHRAPALNFVSGLRRSAQQRRTSAWCSSPPEYHRVTISSSRVVGRKIAQASLMVRWRKLAFACGCASVQSGPAPGVSIVTRVVVAGR